jgi:hypothetical protein
VSRTADDSFLAGLALLAFAMELGEQDRSS